MSGSTLTLGESIEPVSGNRDGTPVTMPRDAFTTHGVIVGMTGSGKTGLGVVLLEEVVRSGVPVLVIDPKGDMGNLALSFPGLSGAEFAPWVDPAEARAKGQTTDEAGEAAAATWRKGLQSWGLDASAVATLRAAADVTIYTPGSHAGVPLSVLGSLAAPGGDFDADAEDLRAEIEAFTSSLLVLAGIDADPMSSREHILIATLIERAWRNGQSLDLGALVGQVAQPPLQRVGVFELDRFFPERDREKLAMKLNGLVASPSFQPWLTGAPLDIERLLFTAEGKPRAAVVYLPHLPDEQRMFAVTLLLSKVVSWMRRQPGTSDLRALVYMDEVFGFCPPTGAPPAKRPILTLLKQARAHGVGVVLATQNPVDLDYKAMSNAGTWMVGRLSTERDKARIVEALRSASGDVDGEAIDRLIGGLGKRQFVVLGARNPKPTLFTTRFALSYLRGPLTRDEVERLRLAQSPAQAAPPAAATPPAAVTPPAAAMPPAAATVAEPSTQGATHSAAVTASIVDHPGARAPDTSPQPSVDAMLPPASRRPKAAPAPAVAEGVRVAVLDANAAWAPLVSAVPGGQTMRGIVVVRLQLSFQVPGQFAPSIETWSAIWPTPRETFSIADLRTVSVTDADLRGKMPDAPHWQAPDAPIQAPSWWQQLGDALRAHLQATVKAEVWLHPGYAMASTPGESRASFLRRTRVIADKQADAEAAALSHKMIEHAAAQRKRIDAAAYEIDARAAKAESALAVAMRNEEQARLLGALGKGGSNLEAALAALTAARSETAAAEAGRAKIASARAEIAAFEAKLGERVSAIHAAAIEASEQIEHRVVALAPQDVQIVELAWVWVPAAGPSA